MILYKKVLIVALLLVLTITQQPEKITLNQIYDIELSPNASKQVTVVIDQQIYNDTQLYISAQTPYQDPFEKPKVTVKSDNNFNYQCSYQRDSLMDICSIDTKELTNNRVFTITISCQTKCTLEFAAYLNDAVIIDIGTGGIIEGLKDFGLAEVIQVNVPKGTNYTQIFINAQILNIEKVNQGLTLLANYGSKNETTIPNLQTYSMKGQSTWNDGVGIVISKQLMEPSNVQDNIIKCYLYAAQNMKVKFTTWISNGNKFSIELNKERQDFISYNQERIYTLNLTDQMDKIKDQDIDITITTFSGSPEIQVGFDQQFKSEKQITNDYITGKINTLITPSIRQQMGFKGFIYIRISGFWTTTFKIIAQAFSKDYVPLFVQTTQIIHLKKDEVINFLFSDDIEVKNTDKDIDMIKKYALKIQMIDGNIMLGLKRCKQMQTAYNTSCLFTQKSQIKTDTASQSFKQIKAEIEHSYSTYQIRFTYDFTNCHKNVNDTSNTTFYQCVFQIVAIESDTGTSNKTDFAMTLYKREYSVRLKEGIITKDTVPQNDYHYYIFSLPSLENITQVSFFISTIQGDTILLGSTDDRFPTMFDMQVSNDTIYFASANSLKFDGQKLKKTLYLSVYGFENSDYTLIAMVRRENSQTQNKTQKITQISLTQGVMINYQLQIGQDTLIFGFNPKLNKKIKLTVSNLQGNVHYEVKLKDKAGNEQNIACNSSNSCNFTCSKQNYRYQIVVTGKKQQVQKFSIGYSYTDNLQDNCVQYPMNSPLLVNLDINQTACLKYTLKTIRQLQFLMSLTQLEIFQNNINATLSIKDKKMNIDEHSRTITTQQQRQICSVDDIFSLCPIRIQITSKSKIQFEMILQQVDLQLALFQGISQNIVSKGLSQQEGKDFYFDLLGKDGVKILFTKHQANKYRLIARVMRTETYLVSKQSQFPKFDVKEDKKQYFIRDINSSVSILQISAQQLQKNPCQECILLISVYKKSQEDQMIDNVLSSFNIEVSQKQTKLRLGDNKIDLVQEGQIHIYTLSLANQQENAAVYISSIHSISCANLLLLSKEKQDQVQVHRNFIKLNAGKQYKIGVEGKTSCSFLISFFLTTSQLRQITKNLPLDISVCDKKTNYFIMYHSANTSFRVIQITQSGDSNTYIQTLKNYDDLQSVLNKTLTQFTFNDKGEYADIQISNTDSNFCKQCYYVIAVQGNPNVVEQMIVLDQNKRIPLRENSIFKDKIKNLQTSKQYQYHSITTFNVSVGVLYGDFKLKITAPNGTEVVNQVVTNNKEFIIPHPPATNDDYFDVFDDKSQYNITIMYNNKDAGYFLHIKKHNVSLRIREGIPIITEISNQTENTIEFINLASNGTTDKINVLIEALPISGVSKYKLSEISIQVQVESQKQSQQITNKIIDSRFQSERSINLQLQSVSGTYFLDLKLNSSIPMAKLSVMIVKKQLTHLVGGQNYHLFNNQAIYQIYDNKQNLMIQIFNCKGEVQIHASSNYSKLSENNNGEGQIVMQHANIGNHYVISVAQVQGEYFVQTLKKQSSKDILYRMSYYQYEKNSSLPYKRLHLARDTIEYKQTKAGYEFQLEPILAKQGAEKLNISSIQYKVFIGNSQQDLQSYSQCLLEENSKNILKYMLLIQDNFNDTTTNSPIIKANIQDIKAKFSNQTDKFFVNAVAEVKLIDQSIQNYPQKLKFIYGTTQVLMFKEVPQVQGQKATNLKFVVIFIVLPFLLGSLFLMLACRYCIRRIYSTYYPTELIQEDGGPSQDNFTNPKAVQK